MVSRRSVLVGLVLAIPAAIGAFVACAPTVILPPHAEVLVIVDTDAPVATVAGRLRVDTYAEDGAWLDSRDTPLLQPNDLPASFSVVSDDDTRDRHVLVRLRIYPDGVSRAYRGERYQAPQSFTETLPPKNVTELCADPPELKHGASLVLRRGRAPITTFLPQDDCGQRPTLTGSIAAKIVVEATGSFLFSVTPNDAYASDTTLAIRTACADPSTQIACNDDVMPSVHVDGGLFPDAIFAPGGPTSSILTTLSAGTYYLVTGGAAPIEPSDLTLAWDPPSDAPPIPDAGALPGLDAGPRLLRSDAGTTDDVTPADEPKPSATIERLLWLHLVPGIRRSARVLLTAECAGTMARLPLAPANGVTDPSTGATCIDAHNVLVQLAEATLDPDMSRPDASAQGTFGDPAPCPDVDAGDRICVPGGTFVLGSSLLRDGTATPERLAMVERFSIDRYPVTVGRFRASAPASMKNDPTQLYTNDAPFGVALRNDQAQWCTFSTLPAGREQYALDCVTWDLARAFCQLEGGDLPTEAQFEYAAAVAGKPAKSLYAWGDDPPTCDRAAYGRLDRRYAALLGYNIQTPCEPQYPAGPSPITKFPRDVTPLGIVGMGGNVYEMTLDSSMAYDTACWDAASVKNPICWEEQATTRVSRGAGWSADSQFLLVVFRVSDSPGTLDRGSGFRCAYPGPAR